MQGLDPAFIFGKIERYGNRQYCLRTEQMLFNSYIFILLFLPLCLTGYYLLNSLGSQSPHALAVSF